MAVAIDSLEAQSDIEGQSSTADPQDWQGCRMVAAYSQGDRHAFVAQNAAYLFAAFAAGNPAGEAA
jgi:hypothetical protein